MENAFLAVIFRMKYINRWSLMHNTRNETLTEHTLECALITHYLAIIGNKFFGKDYNPERLAMYALFHDATEILTGDLPTPVKYFNQDIKTTYRDIEKTAAKKLMEYLPRQMEDEYSDYLYQSNLSYDEKRILKGADKLSAYIKCVQEVENGNKEFKAAEAATLAALTAMKCDEVEYFLTHCLPTFLLSIDELNTTL